MSFPQMPRPDQKPPEERPATQGAIQALEGVQAQVQREMTDRQSTLSALEAEATTHREALVRLRAQEESISAGIQRLKAGA